MKADPIATPEQDRLAAFYAGSGSPLVVQVGDCRELLRKMPDESVQCCVTSPPYWGLRDYGQAGQIGQEATPEEFVGAMVEVFREVRRVLKPDGTLWLNLGDTHRGKRLMGMPWRVAIAMQEPEATCVFCCEWEALSEWQNDEENPEWKICPWCHEASIPRISETWMLRQEIIWNKPNAMPEAVKDRCSRSHEHLFMFSKQEQYLYHPIRERVQSDRAPSRKAKASGAGKNGSGRGGSAYDGEGDMRNRRSVWQVPVSQCKEAHFAIYPAELIKPCVMASSNPGDVILDPFGGSGTTGQVALELGRHALLFELNPDYAKIIEKRTNVTPGLALF